MIRISRIYEITEFISKSVYISITLLLFQVALFKKLEEVTKAALVSSILHYIVVYVIDRPPIWVNFIFLFYTGGDLPIYELIYLFCFSIRRYELAGFYLAFSLREDCLLLLSLFSVAKLFKGEIKLYKFIFGFITGLILFKPSILVFDKNYLYSALIWALILKERFLRWEYTKNDKRIEYTEKMLAIIIDTLLLPQTTVLKPNWKILALLATLTGQLTKPFLYIVLFLVCKPPLDPSYTFLTTIGLILLYKGRNYEREYILEKWKKTCGQIKLYQKANQGFDYELPPGIEDPQRKISTNK